MKPNFVNGEPSKGSSAVATRSGASVTDALRALSSRSPQESLGLNQSGLLTAFLQALVGALVLMAILTFGPWLYERSKPASSDRQAEPEKTDASLPPPRVVTPDASAKKSDDPKALEKSGALTKKDLPKLLKEDEIKKGSPVDPLEDLLNKK